MKANSEIERILSGFPFRGYSDQSKRLAKVLWNWPCNVSETSEKAEISKNTHKSIRGSWEGLTLQEKILLFDYLSDVASTVEQRKLKVREEAKR